MGRRFRKMAVAMATLLARTVTTSEATKQRTRLTSDDTERYQADIPRNSLRGHDEKDSTITPPMLRDDQMSVAATHRREMQVLKVPSSFRLLDENLVDLSILSAKIATCFNVEDPASAPPECANARIFSSTWSPDKALVVHAQQHGICFGAFQATTMTADDWAQNLDRGMAEDVCSSDGNCCRSRQGFRDAYRHVSYLADFEVALEDCKKTKCSGGDCDVILTGFSQGGSVATVGAIYLNPEAVITFGQPPTCEDPCNAYDPNRIYRFVNTKPINGDLRYDIVPFLSWGATDHMGHLFVLGEDTENVAYYQNHDAPDISFNHWSYSSVLQIHNMTAYIDRLENLQNFPIGLNGWATGQRCTSLDSECMSPLICSRGVCSTGVDGSRCDNDDDCVSRRCDGLFPKRCMPKLPTHASCNEDSDCLSNYCSWAMCSVP